MTSAKQEKKSTSSWPEKLASLNSGNKASICFYFAIILYSVLSRTGMTVFQLIGYPHGDMVENLLQLVVLVFLFAAILFRDFSRPRQLATVGAIVFGFIVWRVSKEGWFFWTLLFIVSAPEFDYRKLSRIALAVSAAIILITTLVVLLGLYPMNITVRADNGVVRNALGFIHPNSLGIELATLGIAFCVLRFDSFRLVYVPAYILLALFTFYVPVSRMSAILILVVVALWACLNLLSKRGMQAAIAVALIALFALSLLASLVVMFAYNNLGGLTTVLNKVLSGRPYYAHLYYEKAGITLFGYPFSDGPFVNVDGKLKEFLVDNAFDHVLLRYGLISFLGLFGSSLLLYIDAFRKKSDFAVAFGFTMFMLMGICETAACTVDRNYLIIVLPFIIEKVLLERRYVRATSDMQPSARVH